MRSTVNVATRVPHAPMDVDDWQPPAEKTPTPELLKLVGKVHVQCGHPSSAALARAIRVTGGSDEAVAATYFHRCPVCPRRQAPGPACALSLHSDVKDFGDCLGYDLFALADIRGTNQSFLNQVGLATGFQIVTPVDSKRPDVIMEAAMDTWLQGLGIPETNRTDGGGEFEKEFRATPRLNRRRSNEQVELGNALPKLSSIRRTSSTTSPGKPNGSASP